MLKAGALLYVVFLSFVLGTICSSVIIIKFIHNRSIDNLLQQDKLISDVNSAFNLVLDDNSILAGSETKTIDLFGNGTDEVEVKSTPWGMYMIITATAKWKNYCFSKKALTGDDIFFKDHITLYLADHNNYLSLCGRTKIKGFCVLPALGTRRAYIEGQSFTGSKLVDGEIKTSKSSMPEINKMLLDHNNKYLTQSGFQADSIMYLEEFTHSDSITNSFHRKTLYLHTTGPVTIRDKFIKGNIVIKSDYPVELSRYACTENIIIYAPAVVIQEYFKGSLQVFASDSIIVRKKAVLRFPSQVMVISESPEAFIEIEENAGISGAVILLHKKPDKDHEGIIRINKNARINGQVYCNDKVMHQGKIYGSLYCNNFYLRTASSVYENHLLNAEIDFTKLSEYFVGINLLNNTENKEIIRWLY